MRKIIALCLSLSLLFLCACAKPLVPQPRQTPAYVSGVYQISCNDFSFEAEITADRSQMALIFLSPETLRGYRLLCTEGTYTCEMNGVTTAKQRADASPSSVATLCYELLLSLLSPGGTWTETEDGSSYQTDRGYLRLDAAGEIRSFANLAGTLTASRVDPKEKQRGTSPALFFFGLNQFRYSAA